MWWIILCFGHINVSDFNHWVVLEYHARFLVRTLNSLSFFYSFVQKVNSFLIFFLQLGFDAFILYILQAIHLELAEHRLIVQVFSSLRYSLFLLSLLQELCIVFIKYYFLDLCTLMRVHDHWIHSSIFISLHNFFLVVQEREHLVEHVWSNLTSLNAGHLACSLRRIHLYRLHSIPELVKLVDDVLCLVFELEL